MNQKNSKELEQKIVQIDRVARVTAGGKRLQFRVCVVVGDKKGKVGMGVAKASEIPSAVEKAVRWAKKRLISVPIINDTIPHLIKTKFGAAEILLKPAPPGTGVIAGGVIRTVAELAGIKNLVGKILRSENKINNLKAVFLAFQRLKRKTEKEAG